MVYKLSEHLDHVKSSLVADLYQSYIKENQSKFPDSVLNLLSSTEWYGGSDSKAPYYGELQSIEIKNLGNKDASLILKLQKYDAFFNPFTIEIVYKRLFQLHIPPHDLMSVNKLVWRYEEFLFFNPYTQYELQQKMFIHNIEWIGGIIWSIYAEEIEVNWINP